MLAAVVRDFIESGTPVGSKTLVESTDWGLSSATVRSLMAELESDGYLAHPHTSSGRVPTERGYRLYVELLLRERASDRDLFVADVDSTPPPSEALGEFLQKTSRALSSLCGCVGVVLRPSPSRAPVRAVHFFRMDSRRVVVVVEGQGGIVAERVVTVEFPASQSDLAAMGHDLSQRFSGSSLVEVHRALGTELTRDRALYDSARRRLLSLAMSCLSEFFDDADVLVDGGADCVARLEIEHLEAVRHIVRAYEQKDRVAKMLASFLDCEGVQVHIGSVDPKAGGAPELPGLALVAAQYGDGTRSLGCVGVLGPQRMPYERVIQVVDRAARTVSHALRAGFGGATPSNGSIGAGREEN